VLPGYELVFSVPGLPYVEPAFAAVRPTREGAVERFTKETHGVMYTITSDEWEYLLSTEGSYDVVDVTCVAYDGREITGRTLTHVELSNFGTQLPSKRYLQLLRDGAQHWNLNEEWRAHLDGLEAYEPVELDIVGRAALALSVGPTLVASIAPAAAAAGKTLSSGGDTKQAVIAAFLETQNVVWASRTHSSLLGSGQEGKIVAKRRRPHICIAIYYCTGTGIVSTCWYFLLGVISRIFYHICTRLRLHCLARRSIRVHFALR